MEEWKHELFPYEDLPVYRVDGIWLRMNVDKDWTNFGQYPMYPYVTPGEMWVSDGEPEAEILAYVEDMLWEQKGLAQGMTQTEAKAYGLEAEKRYRAQRSGALPKKNYPGLGLLVHLQVLLIKDGLITWIVDSAKIHELADPNFSQGGNHGVYAYVPDREIWIDNAAPQVEWAFDDLHERTERSDMLTKGWDYDKAHRHANVVEFHARAKDPLLRVVQD